MQRLLNFPFTSPQLVHISQKQLNFKDLVFSGKLPISQKEFLI